MCVYVCVFRPLSVATRCLRTTNDGHLWFRFYVMPLVWSVCSILFSLSCQRALVPTGAKWNFLARINTHRKGSKGRQRRKTKKRQRTHNHDSPPDLPLCRDCLPLSGRSLYELLGYWKVEKSRPSFQPLSRARSSLKVLLFAEPCFFLLHKARRVREGKREETASIGGGKTGVLVVDFFIAILSSSVPRFSRSRFVGFKDYRQINRPS